MKVKKLKELLQSMPDDFEVVLAKDAEGNGYSPLADYLFLPTNKNCIVLWPMN